METRNTYNSGSTFFKPTKLDIQCFHGLFKLVGGFGKFVDQPNLLKSRFYALRFVTHITHVLHS